MSLIARLYKVSNIEVAKPKADFFADDQEETVPAIINEENLPLLCCKALFRGLYLWSNNIPIRDGTANFVARGDHPTQFRFDVATGLVPDDKLRLEFYTVNQKKKRPKLIGIFETLLESLSEKEMIDLTGDSQEKLSDRHNYLMQTSLEVKLYYSSPSLEQEKKILGATVDDDDGKTNWGDNFDDGGKRRGHTTRHTDSKNDNRLRKLRKKLLRPRDGADTDTQSDEDFNGSENGDDTLDGMTKAEKLKAQHTNIVLMETGLGRFEGDVYQMKEWQIMVHVLQGKDFPGLELNPYICVQIDNEKRFTGSHKNTNSPFFGEFFTFDFTLPATKMMEKVIYFKVHNQQKVISTFTHTKPIGIFKVDVATVYNEKEHAFERKWAELVNPDAIQITCGHLLLSVAVTERGVSTKNILGEISEEDDDVDKPAKKFIPSAMPRSLFPIQIKITFYGAKELPDMMTKFMANVTNLFRPDSKAVDSYVEVSYNAVRAQTSPQNDASPMWREAFYLIGQFPPLVRTIKIAVKDHSTLQQDRTIASLFIDLFKISETNPKICFLPTFGPSWVFLYGSPREYTINKDQDGLGEGMGEGVCYKGRLLMEIECHPASGDHTANTNVQKEKGLELPDLSKFPGKRNFLLFGCIFDVTMIDKEFASSAIRFELSIGPSGYTNLEDFAKSKQSTSLTPPYDRFPVLNSQRHFRLPINLIKPIIFTKYEFHDYTYRMTISNRLKRAADYMSNLIREFELKVNSKAPEEELKKLYQKMEHYIHTVSCGCADSSLDLRDVSLSGAIHPTLSELLNSPRFTLHMNKLDEKRQKKILHTLEVLKGWISSEITFDEENRFEIVKQLQKIARVLKQLAVDIQPALPDIFLWMICDSKRVAYARMSPEDLLHSSCIGERGLQNGRVQTLFLRRPHTADKANKSSSTNAKVQIYLWLGTEEQEGRISKRLPEGFDNFPSPLSIDHNYITYKESTTYEIRCHCCKARSLIASDDSGLSDPFLSITAGNETQTTPILIESLCPQWDITLVFRKLMHVGNRDTAEEIIGNIVVECYDYDEAGDGPDLLGRFSVTAKLDLFAEGKNYKEKTLQWYEFKLGDKRAGELLAAFELIEVDPDVDEGESIYELEELDKSPSTFQPENYNTKLVKNKLYRIPNEIMPDSKTYEIEVLFWGLRELRPTNILQSFNILQTIQQAEVSIECAGGRLRKTITNVQKHPNFDYTSKEDLAESRLIIPLPNDKNLWPHLSICCIPNRSFGMKKIVGNLVVVDLQKYLEKPYVPLINNNPTDGKKDDAAKPATYDFTRVRQSIGDAYQAVSDKDKDAAKKRLNALEKALNLQKSTNDSEQDLVSNDVLDEERENAENETPEEQKAKTGPGAALPIGQGPLDPAVLTIEQKKKLINMEKNATWWTKYYASKAKLKLQKKQNKIELDDKYQDHYELYADLFDDEKELVVKRHQIWWKKTKKFLGRAKKTQEGIRNFAAHGIEHIEDFTKKSLLDESLENFETDRLQELSLLQTFDFIETELEKVETYEGFTDIFDRFPLYLGKGTNRSDEVPDEKRVFAKFKGKLRIRELPMNISSRRSLTALNNLPRVSVNTALTSSQLQLTTTEPIGSTGQTHIDLIKFDFNKHNVSLKCRLYVVKAILFRSWDRSGKADPFLKVYVNNDLVIDDVKSKIYNTLEPIFGKSFEFEMTIPRQSIIRIQVWDWDALNANDRIAETVIDVENRWLSSHRGTCALPKRYDSAGYNIWRDTKKPEVILKDLCKRSGFNPPVYNENFTAVAIGDQRFDCDIECMTFANTKGADLSYRKAHHESPEDYITQNTALAVLHAWGTKVHPDAALVAEHVECRPLYDPNAPDVEQGKLEMWLDVFPMSRPPSTAPIDITPPKPKSYQLRLIVLNTSDVTLDDENFLTGESSSDIYVKAWIKGENDDYQQTDVHYRSMTGVGNFNWRFIFDFDYVDIEQRIVFSRNDSILEMGKIEKKIPPRIVIRVYDADLISADDFLGECVLNLTHLPVGARSPSKCKADMLTDRKYKSVNLFETKRCVGWWPMIAPAKHGEIRDPKAIGGKVEAEFSLATAEDAEKSPAGRGREGPSPLPPPKRPENSFLWFTSPWKTFQYVIWKNYKWAIVLGILGAILVIFILLAIWSLPGEIVHQVSSKIFNTNSNSG